MTATDILHCLCMNKLLCEAMQDFQYTQPVYYKYASPQAFHFTHIIVYDKVLDHLIFNICNLEN